ncbi:glycosyltransferase family 4 protein [Amorphoplanes nipponensis]|uniref:Glycosyl transferase family 1 n=1 Tax=Actinoplanes nipponensis TaxID=135950 RepID=A0A919MIP0_9ACTN|nr:glycosyltransferase family 4 protein [Actinoplanes nipponensis]GIE50959.1 glycosyl transferase family 1 [Actinoplanes nipponensis]
MRIALLTYRGNPTCGGQGIYVRHLSRELTRLGHRVDVLSGPPYPELDPGVTLVRVPSLDLYRQPDPFRMPALREYRDWIDVVEVATMMTAGFPEPLTFSLRARRLLKASPGRYDVVHDNQTLGYGLLGMLRDGLPLVTTVHHPIQIDRALDLAAADSRSRRVSLRRWYGFTRMQRQVAGRLPGVLTVSGASRDEIVEHLRVPAERITTVPIGTDPDRFAPDPAVPRIPGQIVTTASSDVPLKGLEYLVEAVAKVRTGRPATLVVIGEAKPRRVKDLHERFGAATVRFTGRLSEDNLIHTLRSSQIAVVPSLFEGFSLPVVEAMACGLPVIATTAGALPEVAGPDGVAARLVPPADAEAIAESLRELLDDPAQRERLGRAGRERVEQQFTWARCAERTADSYRAAIAAQKGRSGRC